MKKPVSRRRFLQIVGIGAAGIMTIAGLTKVGAFSDLFGNPQAAQVVLAQGADYQTIVATQFRPRSLTALNGIRNALIAAGAVPSSITVAEMDTNDLRFQITAKRGGRTLLGYIELTDASHSIGDPGRGRAIFTFWLEGNGTEITTTYTPGGHQSYVDEAGLNALLAKLAELELRVPEASVKVRAFLGL